VANPKDHNNVILDINTRLTNSPADEDEKLEDHMKKLDEEFQRQQAQISKVAKKWYLSHFKVDHHQKVVKKREVKYDSLSALLYQLPIVSNTTPLADIQSVKISFDNRIKIIMEDLENMTHVLENTHTPHFLSHKLDTKIIASKTSATNGVSQSQPYYGMSMTSYPGKMMSPFSLHGRSALGTAGQSAHDHRPSDPPTDRLTPYVGQSGVAPSLSQASQAKPCATGRSGYNTRPSGPSADCPITKIGLSGCTYTDQDTSCQTQSSCPTTPAMRHSCSMPSPAHEAECLSTPANPKKIQVVELVWPAKAKSASRSPMHSTQKGRAKFTFNVAKYDKIFDELFKNGNIKLSHTIPPIEELKRCVYCKWHGSFFITPMIVISSIDKYNRL
jgi:hypothetical protein